MAGGAWNFGLSSTASRNYQSMFKSQSDLFIDFEDFDGEDDDDIKDELYPCPFCSEDFDLVDLCCHIDEDHTTEAKIGICPVCATRVGKNLIAHIMTQHGNVFKMSKRISYKNLDSLTCNYGEHKLKPQKDEFHSVFSVSRKELQEMQWQSLFGGSPSAVSSSKMAPDPLLSFLYNTPAAAAADKSGNVQPDSSTEISLEEENSEHALLERHAHPPPLSEKDHEEKAQRSKFVQGLLMSTILDDDL